MKKEQLVEITIRTPDGTEKHYGTGALLPDPSGRALLMYNPEGRLVNIFYPQPGTQVMCEEFVPKPKEKKSTGKDYGH